MKVRIVKIGNSRGIRIPKALLEETGLEGEVEITTEGNSLIVSPSNVAREGWAEAFRTMAGRRDDQTIDGGRYIPSRWDEEEWEWE